MHTAIASVPRLPSKSLRLVELDRDFAGLFQKFRAGILILRGFTVSGLRCDACGSRDGRGFASIASVIVPRGALGAVIVDRRLQRDPRALGIVALLLGIAVERVHDVLIADRERFIERLPARRARRASEHVAVPKPQPVVKYETSSMTSPGPTFR